MTTVLLAWIDSVYKENYELLFVFTFIFDLTSLFFIPDIIKLFV